METIPIEIRPATIDDMPFVINSWILSFRDAVNELNSREYNELMNNRINRIIKSNAKFNVACDVEERDFLVGWICFDLPVIHYVFVKKAFRLMGIASQLLGYSGVTARVVPATHWTSYARKISKRHVGVFKNIYL